jgi:hypothetical protein
MSRGRSVIGGGWVDREVKGAFKVEGLVDINDKLAEGWQLYGPLICYEGSWAQAMTKEHTNDQ